MIQTGTYHTLEVKEITESAILLDAGGDGVWLPRKEAPANTLRGSTITVFLYHDNNEQVVATTKKAKACVGELATLKVVDVSPHGVFLDWGIAKDLFMPRSLHFPDPEVGDSCFVKVIVDPVTGRELAKEKLEDELSNEELTVKEMELVKLVIYRNTDLGYLVVVNGKHLGLIHHNEIFKEYFPGDELGGFVKKIKEDKKLDIMPGKPGHVKAADETDKIIEMLKSNKGFLPYGDKTPADEIYKAFGISKKTFKMSIGNLYKQKKISITPEGIKLN